MSIVESTNELPAGWLRMYTVKTEEEAAKIANGQTAYLYQSKILENFLYLFIPVQESEPS